MSSSSEKFSYTESNSPVKYGVKMEPLETVFSTVKREECFSSHPLNTCSSSPYDSNYELNESKVFVNTRPTQTWQEVTIGKVAKKKKKKKKQICDVCDKSFKTARLLCIHRINVHKIYPIHCQECGKPITKTKSLRAHMREYHPSKLLTCNVCSLGFLKSTDLTRHYLSHQEKSMQGWYMSTFENTEPNNKESKNIKKIVESTDSTAMNIENNIKKEMESTDSTVIDTGNAIKKEMESTNSTVMDTGKNIKKEIQSADSNMETVIRKDIVDLSIVKIEPI